MISPAGTWMGIVSEGDILDLLVIDFNTILLYTIKSDYKSNS